MTLISPPLLSQHHSIPPQKVISPSSSDWISFLFNLLFTLSLFLPLSHLDNFTIRLTHTGVHIMVHMCSDQNCEETLSLFFSGGFIYSPLFSTWLILTCLWDVVFCSFCSTTADNFWLKMSLCLVVWLLSESCFAEPADRQKVMVCICLRQYH